MMTQNKEPNKNDGMRVCILQAAARGYCNEENCRKVVDSTLIEAVVNEVITEIVKALPEIPQMDATHHFSEPFINGCEQYRNLVIKALGVKEKELEK